MLLRTDTRTFIIPKRHIVQISSIDTAVCKIITESESAFQHTFSKDFLVEFLKLINCSEEVIESQVKTITISKEARVTYFMGLKVNFIS